MATVNITKEFKERVQDRIRGMHRKELEAELPNLNKAHSIDAHYLYHYGCWGKDYMHLVHEIPKDWLAKITDAHVEIHGADDDGKAVSCSVRFTGMNAHQRPKDSYYGHTRSVVQYEQLLAMPDVVAGRAEALAAWEENKQVVFLKAKWDKVEKDILEFLGKCKTLNEAVRLFPGVRMYVQRDDLERLDRKVERFSERKKIVQEMATDELTAAAIAARLAGAV
jgi:hypothetical protein